MNNGTGEIPDAIIKLVKAASIVLAVIILVGLAITFL